MIALKNNIVINKVLVLIILVNLVKCDLTSICNYKKTNIPGICITIQNCGDAREDLNSAQYCGVDNNIPKVCCPKKFAQVPSIAEDKCVEYSKIYKNIPEKVEVLTSRITGGTNATYGEFPHMALLGYGELPSVSWDCGGSLVSDKFVLTAGHCVIGASGKSVTRVQLGDIEIDSPYSKTYSVRKVYPYPDYNIATHYHDIGLVELTDTVNFFANIIPACLPKTADIFPSSIVSGFGAINNYGTTSQILQWTNVHYFPINECFTRFKKNSPRLPNGVLDEIQLCYGSKTSGRDACQGDSGGPLQNIDYNLSLYRVIGVVSFGRLCGAPNTPAVYTKVHFYKQWIESIVWGSEIKNALTTPKLEHTTISKSQEEGKIVVGKRVAEQKCEEYSKLYKETDSVREYPHIVDIQYENKNWHCTGTLISEKFVLTGGSCGYDSPTFVRLGEDFRFNNSTTRGLIKIDQIYIHPKYVYPAWYNSLSLIKLEHPVKFSSNIKPACLQTDTGSQPSQNNFSLIGWGKTNDETGNWSDNLQVIGMEEFKNCTSYYEPYSTFRPKGINSTSQLCFGSRDKDKDVCHGFASAPLQFNDPHGGYRVTGVITGGKHCRRAPLIFTKVASYIDWIEEIVWS